MGEFTIPPYGSAPVEIHDDRGGYVDEYQRAVEIYNYQGRKVKILGMCRSACILALAARNVCVGPNAKVMAHLAYEEKSGNRRPDITEQMLYMLPTPIRTRLWGHVQRQYTPESTLGYTDLVDLGVPPCKNTHPRVVFGKKPGVYNYMSYSPSSEVK